LIRTDISQLVGLRRDDALKGTGAGIGKLPITPAVPEAVKLLTLDAAAMKVALDGDRIVVSAVVNLKDAKRLVKRLQANIDLLEAESGDEEAAN
jgi:hypothetical protein